jgi:hypothetical protein
MTTSGPPRPVVRGSVEETLNALPEAEANRLCKAQHYALMACPTFRGSDKHACTTPNPIKHGCPLKCMPADRAAWCAMSSAIGHAVCQNEVVKKNSKPPPREK